MIKKCFCFVFAVVLIGSKLVFGFSGGPPAERAGNPGEICGDDTCASSCHTSFAVNAGSAQFSISLPSSEYKPGQTLDVTIEHYFVKNLSGAFFLKSFGFNFKIVIGKFFVL